MVETVSPTVLWAVWSLGLASYVDCQSNGLVSSVDWSVLWAVWSCGLSVLWAVPSLGLVSSVDWSARTLTCLHAGSRTLDLLV